MNCWDPLSLSSLLCSGLSSCVCVLVHWFRLLTFPFDTVTTSIEFGILLLS